MLMCHKQTISNQGENINMSVEINLTLAGINESGAEYWVHCAECGHHWIAAHLPMDLRRFAKLAKDAACPKGCDAQVHSGKVVKANG